ncbi:hypothetical protein, partial [Mesorhizobium sp. M8A.F.Ca.ET.213.01.1.1]|uniref:hypothetical protein n=1 Tax=Mesorhizobium sp. M8A.F.Ca.ET.213.01.1.1 TaxID=2563970 RepID=UPI001AEDF422
ALPVINAPLQDTADRGLALSATGIPGCLEVVGRQRAWAANPLTKRSLLHLRACLPDSFAPGNLPLVQN